MNSYQMVLHRPVEPAGDSGNLPGLERIPEQFTQKRTFPEWHAAAVSTHFRGGLTLDECTTLLLHAKHWADTLQKFRQESPFR